MILKHVGWSFVVFGSILMSNFWHVHCTQVSDSGPHGPLVIFNTCFTYTEPKMKVSTFSHLIYRVFYNYNLRRYSWIIVTYNFLLVKHIYSCAVNRDWVISHSVVYTFGSHRCATCKFCWGFCTISNLKFLAVANNIKVL